jgi:hypothetical protein
MQSGVVVADARSVWQLFGKTSTVDEAFEEQRANHKKLQKIYKSVESDLNK